MQRSLCLHERPALLPAESVPGVHVGVSALLAASLLLGEGVVVVVHHHAEVLVVDNTTVFTLAVIHMWEEGHLRATGAEDLAMAGEEKVSTSFATISAILVDLLVR